MRVFLFLLVFSPAAFGAGEEVYKAKRALCHDSGATNAKCRKRRGRHD